MSRAVLAPGWTLIAFLLVGSLLYFRAPQLGLHMLASTRRTRLFPPSTRRRTQLEFGTAFLRFSVLAVLYVVLVGCAMIHV